MVRGSARSQQSGFPAELRGSRGAARIVLGKQEVWWLGINYDESYG